MSSYPQSEARELSPEQLQVVERRVAKAVGVDELPPTLTARQAAAAYGCSLDHLWALVREGNAPVAPLRLGRRIVFASAAVLRSLA